MKKLTVKITPFEIQCAMQRGSRYCMIAEAIKRDHPTYRRVEVDKEQIGISTPEGRYTFDQPPLGKIMVLKFDSGEPIEPFSLTLRKPIFRARPAKGKRVAGSSNKGRRGAILRKTPQQRLEQLRDRVFGAKVRPDELAKIRK